MHRHASVNRIYRLVWSHASSSWVPAAETTRGRGKGSCKTLLAAALSLAAGLTEAGPLGGQVIAGSGHIGQTGTLTTITQTSSVLSLSWASFNIAPQETVDFVQPSASAIAVNRITGSNGSQILGHLDANGQVYLINPNGIVFGRGAQVDVGGLVASTLDVTDASLSGDARTFSGTGSGSIVNEGTINAAGGGAGGGYVALLGNHVSNQGIIRAQLGTVAMGAGSAATLTFQGDSLVHLQVDRSVLDSMATNGGLIRADGGQVLMSAGAADALLASVVNNSGVIEARTVQEHDGTIALLGGMAAGTVNVAGTLDASAPAGGNGGSIETSAAHVEVANSATITTAAAHGLTGSWLIDPQDFTVAASGGDITGAALSTELATTNISIQSSAGATAGNGNVNINNPVSWSANKTLTLTASNNININSSVTATGNTAGVILNPNTSNGSEAATGSGTLTFNNGAAIAMSGSNPTVSVSGLTYIVINTVGQAGDATAAPATPSLQGMAATANLNKNYALGSNIDASGTSLWNGGAGFKPIGNYTSSFQGSFTGLGHTISSLFVNLPNSNYVGLFGSSSSGTIQNVGLIGGSVTGSYEVGELAGQSTGVINNSYATGTVTGSNNVGGLVGSLIANYRNATVNNSYATGNVSAGNNGYNVGGLVGGISTAYGSVTVSNSYATGNVSAGNNGYNVGGLVGSMYGKQGYATVNNSYATGNVSAGNNASNVGGLVGINNGSYGIDAISNSYATGNVTVGTGGANVGGLVGSINAPPGASRAISNSYATGTVSAASGGSNVGGLVGINYGYGSIDKSYATGNVSVASGGTSVGGLVGFNSGYGISNPYGNGSISNSYATGAVSSGQNMSGGLNTGGLVGFNYGAINTSYATGHVSGSTTQVGGLVGAHVGGTVSNSFWDTTTSGQTTSAGGRGMVTSAMQSQANFNSATTANGNVNPGWDFSGTWVISGQNYPTLIGVTVVVALTPLTITANNVNKTYNGSAFNGDSNGVTYSIPGAASDFFGTITYTGTSQGVIDVGGGTFTITPGGLQQTTNEYSVTYVSGALTMSKLALSATVAAGNSVYGAALAPGVVTFTNAIGSGTVMAGAVSVNTSGLTSSGGKLIAGTHVGIETAGSTLTGVDAGDYTFAGAFGDYTVTPLALSGVIATGGSVYGSALTPGAVTLTTPIVGDVVTAGTVTVSTINHTSSSGHFTAGTHTGSESVGSPLTGADAGDYTFAGATGNYTVTPLALTGAIATGSSVYGSALTPGAATFSNALTNDLLGTATVAVNTTGLTSTSGNLIAGTHAGVEAVSALGGADAGNYTFAAPTGSYTVSQFALAGSIGAGSSVYGSALTPGAATFSNALTNDLLGAATVTVNTTGHTSTSGNLTAGTHAGVEAVSALTGADAADYTFAGVTGNYTVSALALTGAISAGSSIYGSALTPGSLTLGTPIIGDVVTTGSVSVNTTNQISTSGHLTAGSHIGSESVGSTLTGADAADYTFAGATGNYTVTPLALTVVATGVNKIYDGTASAAPTLSSVAVILDDQVAFTDTAANFAGKNAGSHQAVVVSGITMGGADAADYALNSTTAMTSATISPASLTVAGVAASNKTYDGNTTAVLAGGSLAGVMAGDAGSLALIDAGSFVTKNVGTGIAVAAAETLSGAGASNYVLVQPTGLVASITPATLTYDATPASRTAGLSPTGLGGSLSGFVAGESQSKDTAGTLAWTTPAKAGSGAGHYAIDGGGLTAANYVFIEAPGNAAALTLVPATIPPAVPVPTALPPAALSAIASLQATMQESGADPPESFDQPATLIAAPDADFPASSWSVDPLEDTNRRIGNTLGSVRIVNGGMRMPQ